MKGKEGPRKKGHGDTPELPEVRFRGYGGEKDKGMEYATLDVDTDKPSGALRVYTSMGFRPEREFTFYRKPV